MAVWNEIPRSALPTSLRLDPEYYQPENFRLLSHLTAINAVPIGQFADVTDGIHGSPDWVEQGEGINYLSAKTIKDNYITLAAAGQISQRQHEANPRTAARVGDVLLTTVGTIGNAAVVEDDILPANMDRHLGILRIRGDVDPYYLSAFLNSKYGRFQTLREATGNVQLNLFVDAMKWLLVPVGEQFNRVGDIVRNARQGRDKAAALYAEAEAILHNALGLDALNLSHTLCYEGTFADMEQAQRMDAEHFQPKYARVIEVLKASLVDPKTDALIPLEQLLTTLTNGHTPLRHDLTVGPIPFLTAEHIYDFRIDYDSEKRILENHHIQELGKTQLKPQDLLITIKGRIGNAAVVEELPGPVNINQDVGLFRLVPTVHPYYIAGFLNCVAGKMLIEQICTGQINPFLGLGNLRKILIPVFSQERMNELGEAIAAKVQEAYTARQEAGRLLTEAKQRVEALLVGR